MTSVSQDQATPSLKADQGSRNLLTRILAALVLIPVAIAAAYAGGWFWLGLVLLAVPRFSGEAHFMMSASKSTGKRTHFERAIRSVSVNSAEA